MAIDDVSIGDPEAAFTFVPELGISEATVEGDQVILATEEQAPGTDYTVTVADSVTSLLGTGVDPDANSAGFTSMGSGFSISSVDYLVIAHGASLQITGNQLSSASEVTIGGEPQGFTSDSDSQLTVASVLDSTPTGSTELIVTSESGAEAAFDLTVIHLVINEVDCDQTSTDTGEFVEISAGIAGVDLSGYVLVLYNGNGDRVYGQRQLAGVTNDEGLLLVGPSGFAPEPQITWGGASNQLQNGADGVGLHQGDVADFPGGEGVSAEGLIDAVVYGTSDGADAGLLDGLFGAGNALGSQLDENANRNKDTESIQRCGEARLDSTGWNVTAPTPGASNTCLAPAG